MLIFSEFKIFKTSYITFGVIGKYLLVRQFIEFNPRFETYRFFFYK